MGDAAIRQLGPLLPPARPGAADAAARQAALRGATLLVLVSIVMAGAPRDAARLAAPAPAPHREASLVAHGDHGSLPAAQQPGEDESGAAAVGGQGDHRELDRAVVAAAPVERIGAPRALVRVALLDLPPPAAA